MRRFISFLIVAGATGLLHVLERPRAQFVPTVWPNHVGICRTNYQRKEGDS